jgi:uracil-DNA glycosylase family 4
MITNAVRCVPPQNKPTPAEIKTCRPFLNSRMNTLPNLKVILALGKIAHDSTIAALGLRLKDYPFGHANRHDIPADEITTRAPIMFDSYHCSRYNTNTRRLTPEMFENVFEKICAELD